jgi:hypothetical protein
VVPKLVAFCQEVLYASSGDRIFMKFVYIGGNYPVMGRDEFLPHRTNYLHFPRLSENARLDIHWFNLVGVEKLFSPIEK